MKSGLLAIEPPHVSAGFYFDRMTPQDAFAAVSKLLTALGAIPHGSWEIVRSTSFPNFAMISDLAAQLESVQVRSLERDKLAPTVHVLRATLEVPRVGPILLAFDPVPDELATSVHHPVSVTVSGSLLAMPNHITLRKREQRDRTNVAVFLVHAFRSVAETLDPLYGTIGVEAALPTPPELVTGGAHLGTEIFVSHRLCEKDPSLEHDISAVFEGGSCETWKAGVFFSGWALFNPQGLAVSAPATVGARAARRLGMALRGRVG